MRAGEAENESQAISRPAQGVARKGFPIASSFRRGSWATRAPVEAVDVSWQWLSHALVCTRNPSVIANKAILDETASFTVVSQAAFENMPTSASKIHSVNGRSGVRPSGKVGSGVPCDSPCNLAPYRRKQLRKENTSSRQATCCSA